MLGRMRAVSVLTIMRHREDGLVMGETAVVCAIVVGVAAPV